MVELVIIGGGPAGLAAAYSAWQHGLRDILILERDAELGGILNQCIHNGFGLHRFGQQLTGPEYAGRYIEMLRTTGVRVELGTMVLEVTPDKQVHCVSRSKGYQIIQAKSIILCMGCRERTRGAIGTPGTRPARAFANEEEEIDKFNAANEEFKVSKRKFHHEMGVFNATMEFFMTLLSAAVITVGGYLIMRGEMNYIDLITFSLYIATFINPVRKLANFSEIFARGFAGLERFTALMRVEPALKDAPDAKELEHCRGEIDVDHVSFSYEGEENEGVLHDVSVHIRPGEMLAVVGPSGGGKSTLCQLIPRFYEVSEGAIRIDGEDVRSLTQSSLHRAIGIVQQDVFLFADTVRENIRYGRPDATDEEIVEAAKRAEIYDDIMAMPHGFDTYVGERGTMLSGGQKQRVSIARIFLKNPPILILDEATSALDSVTEVKIQHAFDELARGRTTLVIAHRLSTIRSADRILVVENGRIAEQGSHEALLAQNGEYASLWRTQNGKA